MQIDNKPKILIVFNNEGHKKTASQFEFITCRPESFPTYSTFWYGKQEDLVGNYVDQVEQSVRKSLSDNPDLYGIIADYDTDMNIVSAVLSRHKGSLPFKTPSFEAVSLCNHKYYQRKMENNPIKFSYIDIDSEDWRGTVPCFPFYFKPAYLSASVHQYAIRNFAQLENIVMKLKQDLPRYTNDFKYLTGKYLDQQKYPLTTKNIMLCEELIEDAIQINWEGWADADGNVHTYAFADEITLAPGLFSDFIIPSRQPVDILERIERVCFDFLKSISFTNGFATIEVWIRKNGDNNVIEVNPRPAFDFAKPYKQVYGADLVSDVVKVSRGEKPSIVPYECRSTERYAAYSLIVTRENGKISDLIDLKQVEEEQSRNPDYTFWLADRLKNHDLEITSNEQSGGRTLLIVIFAKNTYAEVEEESMRLKKAFLKKDTYFMK